MAIKVYGHTSTALGSSGGEFLFSRRGQGVKYLGGDQTYTEAELTGVMWLEFQIDDGLAYDIELAESNGAFGGQEAYIQNCLAGEARQFLGPPNWGLKGMIVRTA